MSRCFPYPPPGYSLSKASNDALIKSIKLQREREKAKAERKEKKRQRKEEKKEKKKEEKIEKSLSQSADKRVHTWEKSGANLKCLNIQKEKCDEPEQLERSTLTEEHGQPACTRYYSYSSDNSENSNKRKRPVSPVDVSRNRGNIIKLRLSSNKQIEERFDAPVNNLHPCSISGRSSVSSQPFDARVSAQPVDAFDSGVRRFPYQADEKVACSTSSFAGHAAPSSARAVSMPKQPMSAEERLVHEYENLFSNWVPMPSQTVLDDDDDDSLDWLTRRNNPVIHADKKLRRSYDDNASTCGNSVVYPRAQYLHEADIYALPYAVPF